jgi:hypothetical protein
MPRASVESHPLENALAALIERFPIIILALKERLPVFVALFVVVARSTSEHPVAETVMPVAGRRHSMVHSSLSSCTIKGHTTIGALAREVIPYKRLLGRIRVRID